MSKSSWKVNKFFNKNNFNDFSYNRSFYFSNEDVGKTYNIYNGKSFFNFKVLFQ